MSKNLVLVLTMVLMLVFVSSIAFAGGATDEGDDCDPGQVWDEDMGCVAVFEDGRLNAFDMIATAVGYLDVKECITVNTDDEVASRLQIRIVPARTRPATRSDASQKPGARVPTTAPGVLHELSRKPATTRPTE